MTVSLIYIQDALRAANCSAYGYERDTTPKMEAVAEDGVALTGIAPSTWTKPVAASVLSGQRPHAHGTVFYDSEFDGERLSIVEGFSNDIVTAAFVSNGFLDSSFGFDAGFDVFEAFYESEDDWTTGPAVVTDAVIEFIEGLDDDEDAFILVWTIGPHLPYDSSDLRWGDPETGKSRGGFKSRVRNVGRDRMVARYDDQIRENDAEFGRLIGTLKRAGRYESACVVVAGDHGELFGEGFDTRAARGFGHGKMMPYQLLAEVPLVIKPPSVVDSVPLDDTLASLVDVAPTVCSAHDSIPPESVQGDSLFDPEFDRQRCFVQVPGPNRQDGLYQSVRTDDWNFIKVSHTGSLATALRKGLKSWAKTGLLLNEYLLPIEGGTERYENHRACEHETTEQLRDQLLKTAERDRKMAVGSQDHVERIDEAVAENLEELGYVEQ